MSTTKHRVAAGVPTGGQFATSTRAESGVVLDQADHQEPAYVDVRLDEAQPGDEMCRGGRWSAVTGVAPYERDPLAKNVTLEHPDGRSQTLLMWQGDFQALRRPVDPDTDTGVEAEEAPAPASNPSPIRRRHLAQVRQDPGFLDAMESAEGEVCVRDLEPGDWAREMGDEEWGRVQRVGVHTLTTDAWADSDTDGGDHVVNCVRKKTADRLLTEHGALPTRTITDYAKRRQAALDVADRWEAADTQADRRGIGYSDLRTAARDVWLSGRQAGLVRDADYPGLSHRDTTPAMRDLEQAYFDYNGMTNAAGHSDVLAERLVITVRAAVTEADHYYGERPAAEPRT